MDASLTLPPSLPPSLFLSQWILNELQLEAAMWSQHHHAGKVFYHHKKTGARRRSKPEVVVEMERCMASANVTEFEASKRTMKV